MLTTPKRSTALVLLLAAAAPVAPALGATPPGRAPEVDVLPAGKAELRGSPQIRDVAAGARTLHFAATKIRRTASGTLDARVTTAGGKRVGTLRVDGTHGGGDVTYAARVSGGVRAGRTYTVRFRLGTSAVVERSVKAYDD